MTMTETTWNEVARLRVQRNPQLAAHTDTIMYDWPEGDAHWMWVATGPEDEIIDWALCVRQS
jgi:hypothetical protein